MPAPAFFVILETYVRQRLTEIVFFYPNYGVCEHDQQLECLVNLRKAERALGRKEDDPYQMIMLGLNFF